MKRREFLAFLAIVPAAKAAFAIENRNEEGNIYYMGYRLFWTGYKVGQDNDLLIGQWVAYSQKREGPHFYACTTGAGGKFRSGENFDVTILSDWETVNHLSSEAHKDAVKAKTYQHLLRIIK